MIDVYHTFSACLKDGRVRLGDIITYTDMAHTNVYLGNDLTYDTGHANTAGSGEGAIYKRWICPTPYMTRKVAQILRCYSQWRVQCGVYTVKKNATAQAAKLKKAGYDALIIKDGKSYIVQAGLFDYKDNAVSLCDRIKSSGIDALVKGI